jgi:N-acetyl-alpha-D-glucosaminyl L-malate synthase BshA
VFHQVQQAVPASLVLVGDGPDRGAVEYRVRQLGIEDKVHFTGMIREPLRVVGDADVFLLPSETESFGLAALEAMACGLPVLSTNVGGLPELNADGESGFLSDVGDVDDMAAKAIRMLTDPGLLETLSRGARERARMFDTQAIVPEYEALYQRVIDGRDGGG